MSINYPEYFYFNIYHVEDDTFMGCVRIEFIPMNCIPPSVRARNVASAKFKEDYENFDAIMSTKEMWEQYKIDTWQG